MPTGLKNSPAMPTVGLQQNQPRPAVNESFQVLFANDNQPVSFPGFVVEPGLSVTLRGVNGVTANAAACYAATYADGLTHPGKRTITPDTEINFPTQNLASIWVMGKTGDGVLATVNGAPIG